MENFLDLAQAIDFVLTKQGITNLKKEFNVISSKYRQEIGGESIISTKEQVLSYISGRMIETAVIVDDVLNKVCLVSNFKNDIKTVLDVGSGTGSCLWALSNFLNKASVIALEKEELMIEYAKQLNKGLSCDIEYIQSDVLNKKTENINSCDLVIESFMLNELKEMDRIKAVDYMCEKANDYIIMVEPGTPKSYERMMEIRKYVLSKGFNLILPCLHGGECGLKNDYCNFSVRVERTKTSRQIKNGTLNYEDEKYFYLVFRKENKRAGGYSSVILRRPVYRKGCVDLKLCLKEGEIKSRTVTKSDRENYRKAKDFKHGDITMLG